MLANSCATELLRINLRLCKLTYLFAADLKCIAGSITSNSLPLNLIVLFSSCRAARRLISHRQWRTDITSTVSLSIFSRSTSAQDTLIPANGNGWSTSTETLTALTWDILTCSTTSPWPRTRAKRVSASIWWRRCFSHVDHQQTNPMMPRCFFIIIIFGVTAPEKPGYVLS